MFRPCIALLLLATGLAHAQAPLRQAWVPRAHYGQRLEPQGQVLHIAGQSAPAYALYTQAMPGNLQPMGFMAYAGLKNFKDATSLAQVLPKKWADTPPHHLLQLGLSFTSDGNPEQCYDSAVATGAYDPQIENLCASLKALNRPVLLRLGYEFNGFWNGYHPEAFKQAYNRIGAAIRRHQLNQVALVWCFAVDGDEDDFMKFYPGPQHVDWWGIDIFGEDHFAKPELHAFLDSAEAHGRPVLIGECTPRRVNVDLAEECWRRWFTPFFELIRFRPGIKGFSYINWDWSTTRWAEWGDGRIEGNDRVRQWYTAELAQAWYAHAQPPAQLQQLLHPRP